jgi:hypothetical protein
MIDEPKLPEGISELLWVSKEATSGVRKFYLIETVSKYDRKTYRYLDFPVNKEEISANYIDYTKTLDDQLKRAVLLLESRRPGQAELNDVVKQANIASLVSLVDQMIKEIEVRFQKTEVISLEISEVRFAEILTRYLQELRVKCLILNQPASRPDK